jgi:ubiquinone biosynthesis protein
VANRLHERFEELRIYDLSHLVKEVRETLLHEMDFLREARYMQTPRSNLGEHADILIPRVYSNWCTQDFLVMEHMEGEGLRGMVGRMTLDARFEVLDFINAVTHRDSPKVAHFLMEMTRPNYEIDRQALELEIMDILDTHLEGPLEELRLGRLLLNIMTMVTKYRLHPPMNFVVMIKAIVSTEGSCRMLYPKLNVISEAEPYFKRLAAKRYQVDNLFRNLQMKLSRFMAYQKHIMDAILLIIKKLEKGRITIRFEHHSLGGFQNILENIFNRLTFGIIIAALIIGSSMIITTGVRPHLFGFPALGIIGYIISGIVGLWLVFNIVRGRRY